MEQQARYENEDNLGEGGGKGATSSKPPPPVLEGSSLTAGDPTALQEQSFCRLPAPFPPIKPQPMDIICGRGSRMTHPGNQRFRRLVLERKEIYQQSTRREDKTRITLEIVQQLLSPDPLSLEPARYVTPNQLLSEATRRLSHCQSCPLIGPSTTRNMSFTHTVLVSTRTTAFFSATIRPPFGTK
jgi:hypothetical protein